MKFSDVSKFMGTGLLAASLVVMPGIFPAQAQVGQPDTYVQNEAVETEADYAEDDGFDWGWLGLLGLLGLAGLAPRKRETVHTQTTYRDPDVTVRPGSEYRR